METSTSALAGRESNQLPNRRSRLVARAVLVGLASLGLGVVAHVAGGGALPSMPILLCLAALAVLGSAIAAQAHLPLWGMMLLLGVTQQALHWIFGGLGGASSSFTGGSGHHAEQVPVGGTVPSGGHSPEAMLMLHAHLGAALLIGWSVARYPRIADWAARRRERRVQEQEGAPIN